MYGSCGSDYLSFTYRNSPHYDTIYEENLWLQFQKCRDYCFSGFVNRVFVVDMANYERLR